MAKQLTECKPTVSLNFDFPGFGAINVADAHFVVGFQQAMPASTSLATKLFIKVLCSDRYLEDDSGRVKPEPLARLGKV